MKNSHRPWISFSIAAIAKYHKFCSLKECKFIISQFWRHSGRFGWLLGPGSHEATFKASAGWGSYLEALGESLFPSSLRLLAEFSASWLQGWVSYFLAGCRLGISVRGFIRACIAPPLPSSNQQLRACQVPLSFESLRLPLWAYLFYLSWRKFSTFKGSCILIGSTWKRQTTLPIFRSITLLTSAKPLWLCNLMWPQVLGIRTWTLFRGHYHNYSRVITPTAIPNVQQ